MSSSSGVRGESPLSSSSPLETDCPPQAGATSANATPSAMAPRNPDPTRRTHPLLLTMPISCHGTARRSRRSGLRGADPGDFPRLALCLAFEALDEVIDGRVAAPSSPQGEPNRQRGNVRTFELDAPELVRVE